MLAAQTDAVAEASGSRRAAWVAAIASLLSTIIAIGALVLSIFALRH
jgi:hypothetical protein